MRETKSVRIEWKAESEGTFRAIFSSLGVVDKQGDVTLAGAFETGAKAVVSHFQHSSWMDQLPVGEGVIDSDKSEAWMDGGFWLDTASGKEHYLVCKRSSLMEWSYAFDPEEASYDEKELEKYPGALRILRKLKVYEVSPVLVGAGVGTHTEYVKSSGLRFADHFERVLLENKAFADRVASLVEVRARERKAGAELSKANRDLLADVLASINEGLQPSRDKLLELLEKTDPDRPKREAAALRSAHLRHETRLRELRGALVMGRSN